MSDPDVDGQAARYPDIVLLAMRQYSLELQGDTAIADDVRRIPMDTVMDWHARYQTARKMFWVWCQTFTIVLDELDSLRSYYGDASELLDFEAQEVIWRFYFESCLRSYLYNEPDKATLLDNIIMFEHSHGFFQIGNSYLYPPRAYLLEAYGGLDTKASPAAPICARPAAEARRQRKSDRSMVLTDKLEQLYEADQIATVHVIQLVEYAADNYLKNTYDGINVFEFLRDKIAHWAQTSVFENNAEYSDYNDRDKRVAVNSLAGLKMVRAEKLIVDEIGSRINATRTAPMRIDKERMAQLRKGSVYRP